MSKLIEVDFLSQETPFVSPGKIQAPARLNRAGASWRKEEDRIARSRINESAPHLLVYGRLGRAAATRGNTHGSSAVVLVARNLRDALEIISAKGHVLDCSIVSSTSNEGAPITSLAGTENPTHAP